MTAGTTIDPAGPRRPALRYFGAKWRLAPWIVSHFPRHTCYVEPFGGSGSVLLRKMPSKVDVYNDLDGEVVHFFRMLREHPADLIRALRYTPFSREELVLSSELSDDPLERARRLYVRCWQGRGGGRQIWRTGWRRDKGKRNRSAAETWANLDHLEDVVERLRHCQIECSPAQEVIEAYDGLDTLFYVDPPYVPDTRSARWRTTAYAVEMTQEDHESLLEVLLQVDGMVVLSGYANPLYDDVLCDWRRKTRVTRCDVGHATEVLWINAAAAARHHQRQLPLLEAADA